MASFVGAAEACAAALTTSAALWQQWAQIAIEHLGRAQITALSAARREKDVDASARELIDGLEQYLRDVAELPRLFGLTFFAELHRVRSSRPAPRS